MNDRIQQIFAQLQADGGVLSREVLEVIEAGLLTTDDVIYSGGLFWLR